jgi:diguanylate cyclase (GGDEF)-like protein
MGTSLGVSDTMTLIASKLASLVPFSACALFLYDDTHETLRCRFATGVDAEVIQPLVLRTGQGLTGWVARNRRPLVNARPTADLEAAGAPASTALQSALVCPLLVGEQFIGTVAVYHTAASFYRDDHRRLLDRVCEQAGAVIHNAMVFEQTQEASLTDSLTGLPNRRFMLTHLGRELARAARAKTDVALIVVDLNGFKEINDTYGHHVGDRALREVARALRGAIRPYDVCIRYAGDEFIVVIPGCGREEVSNKCIELQQTVLRLPFDATPGTAIPLTISAGAAVFPTDGDTYEMLLATADSRMYKDKTEWKRDPHRHAMRTAQAAFGELRKTSGM